MSRQTLRDEISNDPLARGYATMTAVEVAADLNTEYRTRQKDSIAGGDVWNRTVGAEYDALNNAQQEQWLSLCGIGDLDPFGPAENVATNIFGSGSTTLSRLADFRTEDISRATELGLGDVKAYDVTKAREQLGLI